MASALREHMQNSGHQLQGPVVAAFQEGADIKQLIGAGHSLADLAAGLEKVCQEHNLGPFAALSPTHPLNKSGESISLPAGQPDGWGGLQEYTLEELTALGTLEQQMGLTAPNLNPNPNPSPNPDK